MFSENDVFESNKVFKRSSASLNNSVPTATKIGDNFDNINNCMSHTVPIDNGNYKAHSYRNFEQPPTRIPPGTAHFQTSSISELGLTYLPQNELFPPTNILQHYLSAANLTAQSDNYVKSVTFAQNFYENREIKVEITSDSPPPICQGNNSEDKITEPRLSETKRKSLENTVRLIENIITNTKPKEKDPLAIETTIVQDDSESDDEVLIKKIPSKSHQTGLTTNESTKEVEITINPTESLYVDKSVIINNIRVKIEETNWPDEDYMNPFHRDCNGMPNYTIGNIKVINKDNSVEEALDTIKNRNVANSIAYYECPHCSLLLIHPKRFIIHVKWHKFGHKEKKRNTRTERRRTMALNRHMKMNPIPEIHIVNKGDDINKKVYPCKDCDSVFDGIWGLKGHRKQYHSDTQMECKICLTVVSGRTELKAHLHRHTDEDQLFRCPHCPKRFKYRHSLIKHAGSHLEKKFSCQECPKKFGTEKLLKLHMKTHERMAKGTTMHCSYCGKGFYEAYSLNVHERTHRNDRPFQCDICQSAFVSNSGLKRHVKVSHISNKSKPFTCKICQKCFSTESIRDRHEVRIHSDNTLFPYGCDFCERRYLSVKDLKNHTYKTHKKHQKTE